MSIVTTETVVSVRNLTRRFGRHHALNDVSLSIPRGCVYGLVGENGAGKTTLIKHLLGLIVPTAGSVRVFGRDPVADPPGVLSRIGYLSEDRDLPDWMKLWEVIRYTRSFYPGWDDDRLCPNGLLGHDPAGGARTVEEPLALEIRAQNRSMR